jgi:hypothetical protein
LSLDGGTLSHRFSFEVDLVRTVHKSIQNGVGVTKVKLFEEPGRMRVQRRESLTARLVGQRARKEDLAAIGGAMDQKILS